MSRSFGLNKTTQHNTHLRSTIGLLKENLKFQTHELASKIVLFNSSLAFFSGDMKSRQSHNIRHISGAMGPQTRDKVMEI